MWKTYLTIRSLLDKILLRLSLGRIGVTGSILDLILGQKPRLTIISLAPLERAGQARENNIMSLEQKEIFYSVRVELFKLKNGGFIIPDIVFEAIDNLQKEYENA